VPCEIASQGPGAACPGDETYVLPPLRWSEHFSSFSLFPSSKLHGPFCFSLFFDWGEDGASLRRTASERFAERNVVPARIIESTFSILFDCLFLDVDERAAGRPPSVPRKLPSLRALDILDPLFCPQLLILYLSLTGSRRVWCADDCSAFDLNRFSTSAPRLLPRVQGASAPPGKLANCEAKKFSSNAQRRGISFPHTGIRFFFGKFLPFSCSFRISLSEITVVEILGNSSPPVPPVFGAWLPVLTLETEFPFLKNSSPCRAAGPTDQAFSPGNLKFSFFFPCPGTGP